MESFEPDALNAMRAAMKRAEEAAEARRLAKEMERSGGEFEIESEQTEESRQPVYELGDPNDLSDILDDLGAMFEDVSPYDGDDDLQVLRHTAAPEPWYREAAEEALPGVLRGMKAPLAVKNLLEAVLVELGDLKRTNAIVLDLLTRLEEKVERNHRALHKPRS
jgi:hypothetical protein